jgi:hypothetical protein
VNPTKVHLALVVVVQRLFVPMGTVAQFTVPATGGATGFWFTFPVTIALKVAVTVTDACTLPTVHCPGPDGAQVLVLVLNPANTYPEFATAVQVLLRPKKTGLGVQVTPPPAKGEAAPVIE